MTTKELLHKEIEQLSDTQAEALLKLVGSFKAYPIPNRPNEILGLFADCPELMDEIVEGAMRDRERMPLRLKNE